MYCWIIVQLKGISFMCINPSPTLFMIMHEWFFLYIHLLFKYYIHFFTILRKTDCLFIKTNCYSCICMLILRLYCHKLHCYTNVVNKCIFTFFCLSSGVYSYLYSYARIVRDILFVFPLVNFPFLELIF